MHKGSHIFLSQGKKLNLKKK